jgi:tetratricopeptide (TPR) repeat protein
VVPAHFFAILKRHGLSASLFAGAAIAGLTPVADGDLWWHLAAGREMVHRGAILGTDPFSVSAAGRPWINVHWLFQLAAYGIHQLGGLSGLVIAKCLVVGLAALLSFTALPRKKGNPSRAIFAVFFLASLIAARHLLLLRPVIATLLFLSIYFLALERFRHEGLARWILPLVLFQIAWANCQGLFALGPAVVGAYAVGAAVGAAFGARRSFPFAAESPARLTPRRQLGWLLLTSLLCLAGSCATPFGLRALALPVELLTRLVPNQGNPFALVAENVPPFLLERSSPAEFWHLKWFIGLVALSFLASARRTLLSHLVLVLGFTGLALMANRNVLLFYWMATPIAAMNAAPLVRRTLLSLRRYRAPFFARWVSRAAVASLLLLAGTAAAHESNLAEPAPFRVPVESARIIGQGGGEGAVFAADHHGGYLIWSLYPRFRPYIDTRLVLRSAGEYANYLELAKEPERFDEFQRRHGFKYVLLPVVYPDRYCALIAHLYASAAWRLVFTNGAETLFAARTPGEDDGWDLGSPATTDRILADAGERFGNSPRLLASARLQLATLDIVTGEVREADRILAATTGVEADALRARSKLASSDIEAADAIGQELLKADANDVRTLDLLALVYAKRGQLGQATNYLRRALAIDPFDDEASTLLAGLEEHRVENGVLPVLKDKGQVSWGP